MKERSGYLPDTFAPNPDQKLYKSNQNNASITAKTLNNKKIFTEVNMLPKFLMLLSNSYLNFAAYCFICFIGQSCIKGGNTRYCKLFYSGSTDMFEVLYEQYVIQTVQHIVVTLHS